MIATIADQSQVAEARRSATERARAAGFDEAGTGRIALAATEMATNLLKHAQGGSIAIDLFADGSGAGLQLLALDQGAGIADVARALEDGYSSGGTPGTGLGAIRRQADGFAIWSRPGLGTVVMARFIRVEAHGAAGVALGAVVAPFPGETLCGDAWSLGRAAEGITLFIVDGSGHGAAAAAAAEIAVKAFRVRDDRSCIHAMQDIHAALGPTRGAAAALACIDCEARVIRFVGIGNIAAAVIGQGTTRRMVSHNGIAGHAAPRIREFTYPFAGDPLVVLHSDGISAKWEIESYPGLASSHPSLVAGILFRDFRRGRDDALVAALRLAS